MIFIANTFASVGSRMLGYESIVHVMFVFLMLSVIFFLLHDTCHFALKFHRDICKFLFYLLLRGEAFICFYSTVKRSFFKRKRFFCSVVQLLTSIQTFFLFIWNSWTKSKKIGVKKKHQKFNGFDKGLISCIIHFFIVLYLFSVIPIVRKSLHNSWYE